MYNFDYVALLNTGRDAVGVISNVRKVDKILLFIQKSRIKHMTL